MNTKMALDHAAKPRRAITNATGVALLKREHHHGPLVRLLTDINAYPKTAKVIAQQNQSALAAGLTQKPRLALDNFAANQPRDSLGRWVDENGGGLSEHDNIERGRHALARALRSKSDVQKAMYRRQTGEIIFPWGHEGSKAKNFTDGGGIAKMVRKHPEQLKALPVTLAKGRIIPHDQEPETKKYVIYKDHIAVLSRVNNKKSWAITHFEDPKKIQELEEKSRPSWMAGKIEGR